MMNSRILVIDDEENVRDSMRAMLEPRRRDLSGIDAIGDELFGSKDAPSAPVQPSALPFSFAVDVAATGAEGLRRVREALAGGKPYAALFVDMRMPGWDGLTTVQHIREHDHQVEVIFVTAYSDYAVRDIVARAGMNVSYHCKPFSSEEIQQVAIRSVYEWNKARQLEQLMDHTARLRAISGDPEDMLPVILAYTLEKSNAQCALFAEKNDAGAWRSTVENGAWTDELRARALGCAAQLLSCANQETVFENTCFCLRFDRFVLVTFSGKDAAPPPSDALYLIRLYMEQARQTLDNARLRKTILEKEKTAAIGAAIAMVVHDLRGPIAGIQGATGYLLDYGPHEQDKANSFIHAIRDSANEAMHYVQDFLEFIRGEGSKPVLQPLPCRAFLREMAEEARTWQEARNVDIEVQAPDGVTFMMDNLKVRRMIANLVKNACEVLRDHPANRAPRVVLRGEITQGKGRLLVSDNGSGLPEQIKGRLFEMFNTAGKTGGTGLGLAIVKKFADAHELEIRAQSDANGTCFSLSGFEAH